MIPMLLYQGYISPDAIPVNLFLFPKLKRSQKSNRFDSVSTIQRAVAEPPREVVATDFQGTFATFELHCNWCIDAQGSYFEELK